MPGTVKSRSFQMLSGNNKCDGCQKVKKSFLNLLLDKSHFITGGYHARTPIGCIGITIMTWKVVLYYSAIWMKIDILFWFILFGIYAILVCKFAPVLHPNKARFGEVITVKQRIEVVVRLVMGYILIIVFWNTQKQEYAGILMMSISEIIISMLIGKEIYKRYEKIKNFFYYISIMYYVLCYNCYGCNI